MFNQTSKVVRDILIGLRGLRGRCSIGACKNQQSVPALSIDQATLIGGHTFPGPRSSSLAPSTLLAKDMSLYCHLAGTEVLRESRTANRPGFLSAWGVLQAPAMGESNDVD